MYSKIRKLEGTYESLHVVVFMSPENLRDGVGEGGALDLTFQNEETKSKGQGTQIQMIDSMSTRPRPMIS